LQKHFFVDNLAKLPNIVPMKCCGPKKTRADYKQQAKIHKALANEARLLIVDSLKECECSVGELVEAVELDISTVSKHLSVLLAAGIVDNRKEGTTVRYRLLTPCVLDMFACTNQVLRGSDG
jgi:DNA-binding transcriptional ArsR family regulator